MSMTLLLSGGVDSTALLAELRSTGNDVHALVVDYGQRHRLELHAAQRIAAHYGVPCDVVELANLAEVLCGSALTTDPMGSVVVPNRNALLVSLAAGHAAARGYTEVALAITRDDHDDFPDCRPAFIEDLAHVVRMGTDQRVRDLLTPFVFMDKREVVEWALRRNAPLDLTWSCYDTGPLHCGRCMACHHRAAALDAATDGHDPTEYASPLVVQ